MSWGHVTQRLYPCPATRLGLNHVHDPHLVWPPARIALRAQVLLGEQVRVLDRAVLGDLNDSPSYLKVAVRVVGIQGRGVDAGIAARVAGLHPAAGPRGGVVPA